MRASIILAAAVVVAAMAAVAAGAAGGGLSVSVSPGSVGPGGLVNVTVRAQPYSVVVLVFKSDGRAVGVRVVGVYSGAVKEVGRMLIVAVGGDGVAVFTVKAPLVPGEYVVEASSSTGGFAEAVLTVRAPAPLAWLLEHRVVVAVVVAVLVAALAYLYLTGVLAA